jgi:hypothetical protein
MRGLLSVLGLLLLAACGHARPDSAPGNNVCGLSRFEIGNTQELQRVNEYANRLRGAGPSWASPEVNMLELSAGGEFGSYGAGFLLGWGSVTSSPRPTARDNIQIVTGVSTGALMSTYAFLGRKDEELKQFYLGLNDDQIYTQRRLSLLWANSLFDASGKSALLKKYITTEVIDAVAAYNGTRSLYIGLANLDSGRFVKVDMTRLANGFNDGKFTSKAQRDDCYRAVIDGATAIEVAFPPVFIDGEMYGDGGVRQHVFLVSPKNALPPDMDMSKVTLRTIMLIHGDMGVQDDTPGVDGATGVKNGVLYVAQRSASIFTDQVLKASIRLANAIARDPGVVMGEHAGKLPKFETFYASASHAACECRKLPEVASQCTSATADIFCQPYMRCLEQKGEEEGQRYALTGRWQSFTSLPLSSEPVCSGTGAPRMPQLKPNFK